MTSRCAPIYIGIVFILSVCFGQTSNAQHFPGLDAISPPGEFENIHVEKIATDSLSTAFVIWVKKEVKPHVHERHTESLYVLEGDGKMLLGSETIQISAGDFLHIPSGTIHSLEVTSQKPVKVISLQAPEFHGKDRKFIDPIRRPAQK